MMVDTSFRTERDWAIVRGMVEGLGIDYKDLDVFITHDHPDHSGLVPELQQLGARVLMNPKETRERADLMHSYSSGQWMTTRNIGIKAYGRSQGPPDYQHFVSCTQIWSKTFSCMEFMHDVNLVERREQEGIIYYRCPDVG